MTMRNRATAYIPPPEDIELPPLDFPQLWYGCSQIPEELNLPWRVYDSEGFFSWPLIIRLIGNIMDGRQQWWSRTHCNEVKERLKKGGK